MMYLGQLLDTINDNELLLIRSSHERSLVYIDEKRASEARNLLTKEARQCVVSDIYSDFSDYNKTNSVTVIYIKPNGALIFAPE